MDVDRLKGNIWEDERELEEVCVELGSYNNDKWYNHFSYDMKDNSTLVWVNGATAHLLEKGHIIILLLILSF